MLEKEIEKRVCNYAKLKGCLVYKFTSPGRRSVPDRMFLCADGTVFFIEFKQKGKKPTPQQQAEITKLRYQGVDVFVCDDVEEGKKGINNLLSPKHYQNLDTLKKLF